MTRIKLAIQNQGRIGKEILPLLTHAGICFDLRERMLYARATNFDLDLLLVRHADILPFLEERAADIGIVGSDMLAEQGWDGDGLELGLSRAELCLMVEEDSTYQTIQDLEGEKIATHFPNLVRGYFATKGIAVKIVPMRGSVEIAPRIQVAPAIVDLVGSGTTMKENNLRILTKLLSTQAMLVSRRGLDRDLSSLRDELVFRLQSVLRSRGKKLFVFHLPKSRLADLRQLKLGLTGPTVAEVQNGVKAICSIQLVVDEDRSWEVATALKSIDASGILVMDIERIIS